MSRLERSATGRGSVRRRAARPPAPQGWERLAITRAEASGSHYEAYKGSGGPGLNRLASVPRDWHA